MESTRRNFIKTSAGAFFAAAAGRVLGAGAPSNRVRLAIAGCREEGRGIWVMRAAMRTPGVEIAWVCDVDSRARAFAVAEVERETGVRPRASADLRKVLEDPLLDGIISETPDHWHAYSAVMAMEAGKHVYVEKPCCFCPREGELLVDAWRRSGKTLQVGSQRRSSANVAAALAWMKENPSAVGRMKWADCWYTVGRGSIGRGKPAPVPEWLDWELWQGPAPRTPYRDNYVHYNWHWFRRWGTAETGNNAPHFADLSRWLLGVKFPERVTASGGLLFPRDDDYEWPDTCDLALEYPGRKLLTFRVASHTADKPRLGMHTGAIVYGENGSVRFGVDDSVEIADAKGASLKRWTPPKADASAASLTNPVGELDMRHVADFVDCIRRGSQGTAAPADEGYMSSYVPIVGNIALDLRESIKTDPETGRPVGNPAADALWRREYEKGWGLLEG